MRWTVALALAALVAVGIGTTAAAGSSQASQSISFRMVEWDILPQTATKTSATKVTFVVRNAGKLDHEFVVLKTAKTAGTLAAKGAAEAPEAGAVGEIGEIKAGTVKKLTLTLKNGHYSLICNLAGHYTNGQFVDFYVR